MRRFEIAQHAFWKHPHLADKLSHFREHVIHQNRGVRQDYAFDAAVRNVTLVPQRNVFVSRHHVSAHEPCQAADLL